MERFNEFDSRCPVFVITYLMVFNFILVSNKGEYRTCIATISKNSLFVRF